MTRIALCFPGQGSQCAGMAVGLETHPLARELLDVADDDGLDLATALHGDDAALRATDIAQPALLLVEVVLAAALVAAGVVGVVVGVAGHSVGEYTALAAAGALDAAAAMRLVIARGRAMAAMSEGGMVALLGAESGAAERICAAVNGTAGQLVVIANFNAPGQIVLSGSAAGIAAVERIAPEMGVRRAVRLNVGGAFHSPLMHEAAARFSDHLDRAVFVGARVPVVSNVDGEPVQDAAGLRGHLRSQLESPVRWIDCVTTLVERLGADVLVEIGPGAVLTGLARRIAPHISTLRIDSLDAAASFGDRLGALSNG